MLTDGRRKLVYLITMRTDFRRKVTYGNAEIGRFRIGHIIAYAREDGDQIPLLRAAVLAGFNDLRSRVVPDSNKDDSWRDDNVAAGPHALVAPAPSRRRRRHVEAYFVGVRSVWVCDREGRGSAMGARRAGTRRSTARYDSRLEIRGRGEAQPATTAHRPPLRAPRAHAGQGRYVCERRALFLPTPIRICIPSLRVPPSPVRSTKAMAHEKAAAPRPPQSTKPPSRKPSPPRRIGISTPTQRVDACPSPLDGGDGESGIPSPFLHLFSASLFPAAPSTFASWGPYPRASPRRREQLLGDEEAACAPLKSLHRRMSRGSPPRCLHPPSAAHFYPSAQRQRNSKSMAPRCKAQAPLLHLSPPPDVPHPPSTLLAQPQILGTVEDEVVADLDGPRTRVSHLVPRTKDGRVVEQIEWRAGRGGRADEARILGVGAVFALETDEGAFGVDLERRVRRSTWRARWITRSLWALGVAAAASILINPQSEAPTAAAAANQMESRHAGAMPTANSGRRRWRELLATQSHLSPSQTQSTYGGRERLPAHLPAVASADDGGGGGMPGLFLHPRPARSQTPWRTGTSKRTHKQRRRNRARCSTTGLHRVLSASRIERAGSPWKLRVEHRIPILVTISQTENDGLYPKNKSATSTLAPPRPASPRLPSPPHIPTPRSPLHLPPASSGGARSWKSSPRSTDVAIPALRDTRRRRPRYANSPARSQTLPHPHLRVQANAQAAGLDTRRPVGDRQACRARGALEGVGRRILLPSVRMRLTRRNTSKRLKLSMKSHSSAASSTLACLYLLRVPSPSPLRRPHSSFTVSLRAEGSRDSAIDIAPASPCPWNARLRRRVARPAPLIPLPPTPTPTSFPACTPTLTSPRATASASGCGDEGEDEEGGEEISGEGKGSHYIVGTYTAKPNPHGKNVEASAVPRLEGLLSKPACDREPKMRQMVTDGVTRIKGLVALLLFPPIFATTSTSPARSLFAISGSGLRNSCLVSLNHHIAHFHAFTTSFFKPRVKSLQVALPQVLEPSRVKPFLKISTDIHTSLQVTKLLSRLQALLFIPFFKWPPSCQVVKNICGHAAFHHALTVDQKKYDAEDVYEIEKTGASAFQDDIDGMVVKQTMAAAVAAGGADLFVL
ncbi:hypothetical protein C8R45DRAFT_1124982 [Mycena sanguinolenta]|nr:hypothetical protein C8R45DRAFT_1124982 [Mycena sanguinolenta]